MAAKSSSATAVFNAGLSKRPLAITFSQQATCSHTYAPRPGLFPEAFALSEGALDFGVTLHEMTSEIDAGPIIEVRRFSLPPHATRLEVLDQAERHAVQLFAELARHCVKSDADLPHAEEQWSGDRTTLQDYQALLERHGDLKSPHEDQLLKSFRA